jgi:hypothetical protein
MNLGQSDSLCISTNGQYAAAAASQGRIVVYRLPADAPGKSDQP